MIFFKGLTFGFYGRGGYFSSPVARQHVDDMAETGAEWVCITPTVMQDTYYSTRMYRDFNITPGDDELVEIINYIHSKEMKVMLRPMIECWDGAQRGWITMPYNHNTIGDRQLNYRDEWFANYTHLVNHYVRIANKTGCESYGLDSELNLLACHTESWVSLIEHTRKIYKGHITTSLVNTERFIDHLDRKDFWLYALDSVGTSMYHPASSQGEASVDEMVGYLAPKAEEMTRFAEKLGVPFYFGETGCCSQNGAAGKPSYWENGTEYNGEVQANYLSAIIKLFSQYSWWRGLFWWKWDQNCSLTTWQPTPPYSELGFTIHGKPAENVFRAWCGK